ncbi:outer membrane protein [Sphingomonas japonica]|uniref:Outer membrane immunogenic protein n=1 Tax=Sphingomonas japonica TaxID=511662 RepID=A0ABX0U0E5_9SPHN|nr:outer membrane beta-barrel protein [Sphingomonas japonica]NIJ23119.1 outer membrane immunogenic protein [Sphingomonas japonica]
MRYTLAAALVASTAFAAPAFAQDINPTFTGPRIAILGGYDTITPGSTEDADNDNNDQSVDGFLYGVEAGYDIALGGAVVGAEVELNDSTGKVENDNGDSENFGFGRVAPGRDLYLGVRAGVLATPSTLVYAKGGYTNARLDVIGGLGNDERDQNYELDGWRLGAGLEQAIGTNSFAKIEYRYSNYESANFEYLDGEVTNDFDIDTDRHSIVAGVGIRF